MSLITKTSWSLVGALSQSLTGLISVIIITRLLNHANAGSFTYILWLVDTIAIVCGLGLQNSIVKFGAEKNVNNENSVFINQNWIFKLFLITTVMGMTVVVSLTVLDLSVIKNSLSLIVTMFFTRSLGSFFLAFISGTQDFKTYSKIVVSSNFIQLISLYYLINSIGITGVFLGYIFGSMLPAFLFLVKLKNNRINSAIKSCEKKRVLKYSIETWLALLIGVVVWSKFEIFFIEKHAGVEEVAFFNVALTLSAVISQFPSLVSGSMLPYFSEQLSLKNHENINSTYNIMTIFISLIIFPLSFFSAALAPKLIPLIYGERYLDSVAPAQILAIAAALSFGTTGTYVLMAKEKSLFMALGGLFGGALLCVLCVVLIPHYGSIGASIARLFAQLSAVVLGSYYINSKMNIEFPLKAIIKIFAASAAGAIGVFTLVSITGSFYGVFSGIMFGIAIYTICLRGLRIFTADQSLSTVIPPSRLPRFFKYIMKFCLNIQ